MARLRSRSLPGSMNRPTAQALLAEDAATANRPVWGPGLGLASWAHAVPSQCSTKEVVPLFELPTAQALPAVVVAAPSRKAPLAGVGLGCWAHFVPVQARISVLSEVPLL